MYQKQIVVLVIEDNGTTSHEPPARWRWQDMLDVTSVQVIAAGEVERQYSLSDCRYWDTDPLGGCASRVWPDPHTGIVMCETHHNKVNPPKLEDAQAVEDVKNIIDGLRPRIWDAPGPVPADKPVWVHIDGEACEGVIHPFSSRTGVCGQHDRRVVLITEELANEMLDDTRRAAEELLVAEFEHDSDPENR